MMRKHSLAALAVLALLSATAPAADWPQWRGPELRGTSPETKLPVKWSASEGLAWKLSLPTGSGSTPIVSGDRVFLNVAEGETVSLWCLDRKTGAATWKRPLGSSAGHAHKKHNMSTPSPVTDGRRVYAMTGQGALKGFYVRRAGAVGPRRAEGLRPVRHQLGLRQLAAAARRRALRAGAPRHEDRRSVVPAGASTPPRARTASASSGPRRRRRSRPTPTPRRPSRAAASRSRSSSRAATS